MKVATLNINSVNARLDNLCEWLRQNQPDVLFLQEIKCEFNNFPFFELQMNGYEAKILGQKSYNGVAILSKYPLKVIAENLPNFPDDNSRYLECEVKIGKTDYIVASLYLPNGNPPYNNPNDCSKFEYKLKWMDALIKRANDLMIQNRYVILGGDFNVILSGQDVYNPQEFEGNALYRPEVKNRLRYMLRTGWTDSYRAIYPEKPGYTFWDYTGAAFINDLGMRIDYILVSPAMADRLVDCHIDKEFRKKDKSSDHTVLTALFKD